MTANVLPQDEAACIESGMNGFLGKPLQKHLLTQCLLKFSGAATITEISREPSTATRHTFNIALVREEYDGMIDIYQNGLATFMKSYRDMLNEIKQHIDIGDHFKMTASCHTLKGVLANLFAEKATDRAFQLEKEGKSNGTEKLNATFKSLEEDIDEFISATEKWNLDKAS